MMFWSSVMEQILGALKNEKISGTLLVTFLLVAWYAYSWAGEEFVRKDEFKELKTLMVDYISDSHIVDASQLLRDKKLVLKIAKATDEPDSQILHYEAEVKQAELYRDCLIHKEPNCKHLKPPE